MTRFYVFALAQDVRESYQAGRLLSGKTIERASRERLQLVPSLLAHAATYTRPERSELTLILDTMVQIQARAQAHHTHTLVLFSRVRGPAFRERAAAGDTLFFEVDGHLMRAAMPSSRRPS